MTQCLACVSGVPTASGTPSPGYHLLSISDANTLKAGCTATYKPPLTTRCDMSSTLLSVFVDYVSRGGGANARERLARFLSAGLLPTLLSCLADPAATLQRC